MTDLSKTTTPQTGTEPTKKASTDELVALPGAPEGSWLETWQHLTPEAKDRTKQQVHDILLLKSAVSRNGNPGTYDQQACLVDLELAGHHVALGQSGAQEITSALVATVEARLEEEKRFVELNRQQYFSGRAVQMMIIGIVVQGGGLAALIYALSFVVGGVPVQLWGVKTLSVVSVVICAIAGSLARIVHECQSGVADEMALRNVLSMAATTAARPLLAAVLALFVFALFQSGLIGIPFEGSNQLNPGTFARADFFFVALAFVIGFNDSLGLKFLAFIGKYQPPART